MARPVTRLSRRPRVKPIPAVAPVGGLNARDALANMPAADAITMDNWFPQTGHIETRKGFTEHCTGLGGPVYGIVPYNGATTIKQLAFANGKIWNTTTAGAPAALAVGFASDKWHSSMFTNAANFWRIFVNGVDTPQKYDGAAVSATVITGITGGATNLFKVFSFKGRLYFAAVGQAGFYYLPVGAIAGAATYFDLGQIASHGGVLKEICSVTKDSGDGPDDYIVFIMSTGEYIVYAGYDPSSATNWALVGRYFIAPPIGDNPVLKYGGDTLVITRLGLVSLLRSFDGEPFNPDTDTITYKLGNALEASMQFQSVYGWQPILFPQSNMLLLNVPQSSALGAYYQYVMNTRTNAWCRFTGMNGIAWAEVDSELFFGTYEGNVYQAENGFDDDGADIRADCRQAYSIFENPYNKHFQTARVITAFSSTTVPVTVGFGVDFVDAPPEYGSPSTTDADSLWDIALWDIAMWGAESGVGFLFSDLGALGTWGSIQVRGLVSGDQLKWYATQFQIENAGLVGEV